MKTKYDWSDIPEEINWIAKDYDGGLYGFDKKPKSWALGFLKNGNIKRRLHIQSSCIEWQNSLEERPK